ncbi:MAG: hypothetical protein ACOY5F_20045 [Pseudomonadota bacterium]
MSELVLKDSSSKMVFAPYRENNAAIDVDNWQDVFAEAIKRLKETAETPRVLVEGDDLASSYNLLFENPSRNHFYAKCKASMLAGPMYSHSRNRSLVSALARVAALRDSRTDRCELLPLLALRSGKTNDLCPYWGSKKLLEILFRPEFADPDPFHGFEAYSVRNWDGYDAEPIHPDTLKIAKAMYDILPATLGKPDVSPAADGSIGFEWLHDEGPYRKLFIDIGPGKVWHAYWRLASGKTGKIRNQLFDGQTRTTLDGIARSLELNEVI